MPSIQLQAKLRAYTRAPFYSDYIREAPSTDAEYVRKNGEWVELDTTLLQDKLEEFHNAVVKLQTQLDAVDIKFYPSTNQLVFIDGYGNETFVTLPGANVDNTTIGLTADNALYVMDTPDGSTIKVVDVIKTPSKYDESIMQKVSGTLRVAGIYAEDTQVILTGDNILTRLNRAEKNISDIEHYVQGTGGFLDPYNFESDLRNSYMDSIDPSTGHTYRDTLLNTRAYVELNNGVPFKIPDQTKIKNLFDGHIWVFISSDDKWVDEGADTIVTANNGGVIGGVTGTQYDPTDPSTKFKVSIVTDDKNVSTGVMTVNGLEDEFNKVVYKNDDDTYPVADTYVKRTNYGTVRTNDSYDDFDAINRHEFMQWQENITLSDADVRAIVDQLYLPDLTVLNVSI